MNALVKENTDSVLICAIGPLTIGLSSLEVQSIMALRPAAKLPLTPDYAMGAFIHQGKSTSLVDLRIKFKLAESTGEQNPVLLVIHLDEDKAVAFLVDSINENSDLSPSEIQKLFSSDSYKLADVGGEHVYFTSLKYLLNASRDLFSGADGKEENIPVISSACANDETFNEPVIGNDIETDNLNVSELDASSIQGNEIDGEKDSNITNEVVSETDNEIDFPEIDSAEIDGLEADNLDVENLEDDGLEVDCLENESLESESLESESLGGESLEAQKIEPNISEIEGVPEQDPININLLVSDNEETDDIVLPDISASEASDIIAGRVEDKDFNVDDFIVPEGDSDNSRSKTEDEQESEMVINEHAAYSFRDDNYNLQLDISEKEGGRVSLKKNKPVLYAAAITVLLLGGIVIFYGTENSDSDILVSESSNVSDLESAGLYERENQNIVIEKSSPVVLIIKSEKVSIEVRRYNGSDGDKHSTAEEVSAPSLNNSAEPISVFTHTVKHNVIDGDTLWGLAQRYLNNPYLYPEIANNNDIKNPDLIHPGDVVIIKTIK
ncbi:MAG: chemotaxis protein CheW [Gammaproteobacteria bacterium]|nr:chemotaxis protein CheW [Gammaproteobacteria bacterium]